MKKIWIVLLTGAMSISLVACQGADSQETVQEEIAAESTQQAETEEIAESEETKAEETQTGGAQTEETENLESESSDAVSAEAEGAENILVAYFSYAENAELPDGVDASSTASIQTWNNQLTGNTGVVANMIAEEMGAELFSIQTVEKYPDSYEATIDQGQEEQSNNARPELATHIENLEQYEVVFLGFPNWWGDMPMAMYSFLDEVDLSGKTVIPFVTSGGSGFSRTVSTMEGLEAEASFQEGISISDSSAMDAQNQIHEWLVELGYVQ